MNFRLRHLFKASLSQAVFRLDTTNFFFDRPRLDYQPLPWVGIEKAEIRGNASVVRWRLIKKKLIKDNRRSLKDIGCLYGYFCLASAEEFGYQVFGVDQDERSLRIARYAASKQGHGRSSFLKLLITPDSVSNLPVTDVTLLLSLWHHWVFHFGLQQAEGMLKQVWRLTSKEMFFESGGREVADEFGLDFGKRSSGGFYADMLGKLTEAKVELIGSSHVGNYKHYINKGLKRTLFRVSR